MRRIPGDIDMCMQVHGGTTEDDIDKFIRNAEMEAANNSESNMDTVVFFDEANTTDAIGLIKEIMCDRRLHGRPVSKDLKFIAACNPYRKLAILFTDCVLYLDVIFLVLGIMKT